MEPTRKLIRELSGPTCLCSIRAKVIDRTSVHSAGEDTPLLYRSITFQDEEGTEMQCFLYNESLEMFDDAIDDYMEYDIYNATLKIIPDKANIVPEAKLYEIELNSRTIIRRVFRRRSHSTPRYVLIASIPRTITLDARYDILGIVVYVEQLHQFTTHNGQPLAVREIVILDHSHEQVMVVSTWADLAINDCEALHSIASTFPVVGFTALMSCFKKGFSLSTTHSTCIIIDPPGENADALRAWGKENAALLASTSRRVFEVPLPETNRITTTMADRLAKSYNNTLQEERPWLKVSIPGFYYKDVRLYLGCSSCGTGNIEDVGVSYTCISCMTENVVSTPRMSIIFEAIDETGSHTFTAFTDNAERLLEMSAMTLHSMHVQERDCYLQHISQRIRHAPCYIQVMPSTSLFRARKLGWLLKQVSLT